MEEPYVHRKSARMRKKYAKTGICSKSTKSIVESVFVGTKLTITAPSQNGSPLRNPPPTGNLLESRPSLLMFAEEDRDAYRRSLCSANGTRSDPRRRLPRKTCSNQIQF